MAEIRFNTEASGWQIWDATNEVFIPPDANNLGGDAIEHYITLSQNEDGDTLISFDINGRSSGSNWMISITLQGVTIIDLGGAPFEMLGVTLLAQQNIKKQA